MLNITVFDSAAHELVVGENRRLGSGGAAPGGGQGQTMKMFVCMFAAMFMCGSASVGFGQPGGVDPACTLEQHCKQLDEDNMWAPGTCMYLMDSGQLVLENIEHDVATYDIKDVFGARFWSV